MLPFSASTTDIVNPDPARRTEATRPEPPTNPNDEHFEAIIAEMDVLVSHAISAREAAWRGNSIFLKMHLFDTRAALLAALAKFKKIVETAETRQ
jgi:hypothetical protein